MEENPPKNKVEQKEFPELPELTIRDPRGDKNFMIGFESENRAVVGALNDAIRKVLEENGLDAYHQIGADPEDPNKPGYHAWEIWRKSISRKEIESFLPKIKTEAEEILPFYL